MAGSNTTVIDATTGLIEAVTGLVKATTPGGGSGGGGLPTPGNPLTSDSPAWLDFNHPDGSAGVEKLGEAYFDAHVASDTPPNPNHNPARKWERSKGPTWKDLARIYRRLLDPSEFFVSPGGAAPDVVRDQPLGFLRNLQGFLHFYDVKKPDATIAEIAAATNPAQDPLALWPTTGGFPTKPTTGTLRDAISLYLSFFNRDNTAAPGQLANRGLDNQSQTGGALGTFTATAPPAPPAPLPSNYVLFTHGQLVQLRHVFVTQEDMRLLAPFDVLDTQVW